MREATIILPNYDNNGKALNHTWPRRFFARTYGGYTATTAAGGWNNPAGELIEEAVTVYTIAMEPTLANADNLARFAAILAGHYSQNCVYVRLPFGHVFLINADGRDVPADTDNEYLSHAAGRPYGAFDGA